MPHQVEQAFLDAFDAHADALFRHASFRIKSRERAGDLTQDAFIKAWDYVRGGGVVGQWRSFLYRVLNNLIIDEYRRTKESSLDALLEDDPVRASAALATGSRETYEGHLDDELMIAKIRERIPELPDLYRSAITLRYIDGLSPKEIATVLGIEENVASVRIHRGLTKLRELCKPFTTHE